MLTFVKVIRDCLTDDFGCDDDEHDGWAMSGKSECSGTEHGDKEHKEPKQQKRHEKKGCKTSAERLCPRKRSTGHVAGSGDWIPPARPGLIPGTWVGPTLIFEGIASPGIPTLLPPLNPIGSRQGSQLQITAGDSAKGH